ncbi:TPA: hypothetical protein SUB30_004789 [Bacillus pseudomycoides]|nr:hypothetical protein [Bacillus pseudomycoides]
MNKYTEDVESVESLHRVMEALDILEKEYVITKKIEVRKMVISKEEFKVNIWHIEES